MTELPSLRKQNRGDEFQPSITEHRVATCWVNKAVETLTGRVYFLTKMIKKAALVNQDRN